MNIVDFISIGPNITAIDTEGVLYTWSLLSSSTSTSTSTSTSSFPFISNVASIQLTHHKPLALAHLAPYICICTSQQILFIKHSQLINKSQQIIKIVLPEEKYDEITCMAILTDNHGDFSQQLGQMTDEDSVHVVYGTKSGKIFVGQNIFSQGENSKLLRSEIVCNIFQENESGKNQEILSIVMMPMREDTLAMIGTNHGRLLMVNLVARKIVEDLTLSNGFERKKIEPINSISIGLHKFYTIHKTYIIEWSLELQKCLGYYSYLNPYSILITDKLCYEQPYLLISGPNRFIEGKKLQPENNSAQILRLETSLQAVTKVKEVDGAIFCAGSNGMIEIFRLGVQSLLLYSSKCI